MRAITISVFIAIALAMVIVEFLARRPGSPMASFGDLVGTAVRSRPAQFGFVLAWWWLGVHFL